MAIPRVGRHSCLWPVLLFLAPVWASAAGLSVDVKTSSLRWLDGGAELTLELRNDSTRPVPARVSLEILDPRDAVVVHIQGSIALPSGSSQATFPLVDFDLSDHPLVLVYRLRYRVEPEPGDEFIRAAAGMFALSRLQTPDLFDLHIIGFDTVAVGSRLKVVVSTLHPITRAAVPGVEVFGTLELLADFKLPIREARSVTDEGGVALLVFETPGDLAADDAKLLVQASRDTLVAKAVLDIGISRDPIIHLQTDKELYQPGQTLHMRALAFDSSHHAIAGASASFKATGPDGQLLFTSPVRTSRYGVTSTDWKLPPNTPLGTYSVEVQMDEARFGRDASRGTSVRVSRYDLPDFAITAVPDRKYYLPGQSADVTVKADYLFGQPVTTGQVRIAAEERERWSTDLGRWVTQPAPLFEGALDDSGTCTLHLDLGAAHDSLVQNRYDHYQDITYTASVTDASTGRTERRFFDVRISKEPIHLYAIDIPWGAPGGDPFDFFISSFEADGTPVSVEIAVLQSSGPNCSSGAQQTRLIRTVRTNRYGLAKVRGLVMTPSPCDLLLLESHDGEGRKAGHFEERVVFGTEAPIRLETDRTILRPGEPVSVRVFGGGSAVIVQLVRDLEVLRSETALLRGGTATTVFPWDPAFEGVLYVIAYPSDSTGRWTVDGACLPVVYPSGSSLNLRARLDRSTYRPGDEARMVFDLYQGSGTPVPGVLGVVAVDRALLEREEQERLRPSWTWEESYAGVSTEDILRLDVRRQVPADLDLVAEVLLSGNALPSSLGSQRFQTDAASEFVPFFEEKLASFRTAAEFALLDPPMDEQEGFRAIREAEVVIAGMVDPWGCPYRLRITPHSNRLVLDVETAGPDQHFETGDDFVVSAASWYYFERPGRIIDRAFEAHHERTGSFIRDESTLAAELSQLGLDLRTVRDPWGCPYEIGFEVSPTHYLINVTSDGPDQQSASRASVDGDDVRVWTASIDSFRETRQAIERALDSAMAERDPFPATLPEFERVLSRAGLRLSNVCDPWDQPALAVFSEQEQYGDATRIYAYSRYPDPPNRRIEIEPVTRRVGWIRMWSQGPDGLPHTQDDCELASFSRILSEQPAGGERRPMEPLPFHAPGYGSIHGTVRDIDGRPVAAVYVSAAREGLVVRRATTRVGGTYTLEGLPAGLYEVCFERAGFTTILIDHVPVVAAESLKLDATLEVSGIAEVVTVTAESPVLDTKRTGIGFNQGQDEPLATSAIATPRLRQYFPETLVWEPSLETDESGRAELRFRLADSTTTWKLTSTASTEDGRMVTIDRDVLATLPFFVDQDPPRILTQGDEISLPVGLHSDLTHRVIVELAMKPAPWLKTVGSRVGPVQVLPRKPLWESLTFRVVEPVREAPLRVTATGNGVGDAVEKPVTVHPDGEEVVTTESQLLLGQAIMQAVVPLDALPGSVEAELVLYPNLISQVAESAERVLERPHGCAEQTASIAFANLLFLLNAAPQAPETPALARALRHVQEGYERLLGFQQQSGGFSYWRSGKPDSALTAHVIRFLRRAQGVVGVDEAVPKRARDWLVTNQASDGRWPTLMGELEDRNQTLALTAMILRVLAEAATDGADPAIEERLLRGLGYLRDRLDEIPEPYALACYCIATLAAGDKSAAADGVRQLSGLAHEEAGTAYWSLETNTPFYGRGVAGRIETTALAVQALARAQAAGIAVQGDIIDRGVLFLLRHKDTLGAWSSTQATVNALEALLAQLSRESSVSELPGSSLPIDIIINGESVVDHAAADFLTGASRVDITGSLHTGENRIEIRSARPVPAGLARVVVGSYRPWARPDAQSRADSASPLTLAVKFDTTEARTGSPITCRVKAERIGFKGYGMLLAEIGLPPGADVDRSSLEEARARNGSALSMYEVQPDRVVLYLWPEAGSTELTFKFRPRFGMKAKSAPSVLFEYYNPEARAVVPPVDFIVQARSH